MPTYSYHCDACGRDFEKEQRISEPAIKKCALCGKSKARRMIASGNFILKGGGWYSDGYGSSSSKSGKSSVTSKSESPAGSDSKSSDSKSSDSKSSDSKGSSDSSAAPSAPASSSSSD